MIARNVTLLLSTAVVGRVHIALSKTWPSEEVSRAHPREDRPRQRRSRFFFLEEAKLTPLERQRGQNAVASVEHHDVDRNCESRNYRETTWLYTLQETEEFLERQLRLKDTRAQKEKRLLTSTGVHWQRQVASLSKSRRTYDTT